MPASATAPTRANFIACHQFYFLETNDVLRNIEEGGVFLLNTVFNQDEIWAHIPRRTAQAIKDKKLKFFTKIFKFFIF